MNPQRKLKTYALKIKLKPDIVSLYPLIETKQTAAHIMKKSKNSLYGVKT